MKTRLSTLLTIVLLSYGSKILAHDFWLLPEQFLVNQNQNTNIYFKVGHHGSEESWGLRWDRVVSIREYHNQGVTDLARNLLPKSNLSEGKTSNAFQRVGTSVIGFESYHSVSVLAAEKFNSYVKNEGLTLVQKSREVANELDTAGVEIYSRKAKAIVQVGSKLTNNVLEPVGLTLEIVPVEHPYADTKNTDLRVKVLFMGKPLAGALVKLISMSDVKDNSDSVITDDKGIASFSLEKSGKWRFNTVWSIPLRGNNRADYETYFSSLTLGYE